MQRTKLLSMLGGLTALALAASCDSFLDPSPSDVLAPETFYKTSSDAVAAVNGVYEPGFKPTGGVARPSQKAQGVPHRMVIPCRDKVAPPAARWLRAC